MAFGPGVYDAECTMVRDATGADATLVIVIGGDRGSGFSAQFDLDRPMLLAVVPTVLRTMADEIEAGRG